MLILWRGPRGCSPAGERDPRTRRESRLCAARRRARPAGGAGRPAARGGRAGRRDRSSLVALVATDQAAARRARGGVAATAVGAESGIHVNAPDT